MDEFNIFYRYQRRIVTYPGIKKNTYVVTEYGHVFEIIQYPCIYARLLCPILNTYGYYQIRLIGEDGKVKLPMLSRIVAWEFVFINRDINLQVDHKDSNKLNNHYSNLEWVTNLENQRRAYKNHLNKSINSYKSDEEINLVCYLLSTTNWTYDKICKEAGLDLNVNQAKGLCSDILSKTYWNHISCNYDFTKRLNIRRKFITLKEKDDMLKMYTDGASYLDIYHWLYGKEPTKKSMESFKRVMSRIISKGFIDYPERE